MKEGNMGRGKTLNTTGMRVVRQKESELLSYIPSAWRMQRCMEQINVGTEFTTSEGVDGERAEGGSGLEPDPSKRSRWRVVAVNRWHFTAEFIKPHSGANGLRHSWTWADALTGRIRIC